MCVWRGKRNWEERFPHWNWPIILGLLIVNNTAFSVMSPSIYQFITTPRQPTEVLVTDENSGRSWPGLGGSDTLYAWALLAYSIGEFVVAPVAGFTTERYSYVFSLLTTLFLFVAGGLFYARATEVWMAIVARLIIGLGAGYGAVVVHSYLGEMSTRLDKIREKQEKKPIKHVFYILFLFLMNGAFIFSFGSTAIVSQFDGVNPYYWPGYFVAALAVLYGCIMLIFFRDIRPPPKLNQLKVKCQCLSGIKLTTQLQSNWKMQFVIYGYLTFCGLAGGHLYALLAALITPVLSNQFGFTVKYTSYFLIGVAVAQFASCFIQIAVKVFNVDNRKMLSLAFVLVFSGSLLIGDWQAIGREDPCLSDYSHITNTSCSGLMTDDLNTTSNLQEICEALSSSGHQCFWNPQSRITGDCCNTCNRICLSKQTTINFYQFTLGIALISFATPLAFVLVSAIASDIAPVTSQGTAMSVVVGAPSLSRIISPLWLVESYQISGNHTYISAAITALIFLCMFAGMVVLYKNLAPRSRSLVSSRKHESTNGIEESADTKTQDLWDVENEDLEMKC